MRPDVVRAAAGGIGFLVVVVAATGWLYVVQPQHAVPGPPVADALPLDELSRRSAVPLLVFVAVWGAAGLLVGRLAALAGAGRTRAALLCGLAVCAWLLLTDALSLYVVRQVPFTQAWRAAVGTHAVYLAAAVVAAGGALLGRPQPVSSTLVRRAIAGVVVVSGLVDVASAVTPAIVSRLRALDAVVPAAVPELATALVVPAGLALVLLGRGLWRGKRRSWQLTVGLLAAAALLHLLKGLDFEEATTSVLLAVLLVARRGDFGVRGDPAARGRVVLHAAAYVSGIFLYGAAAIAVNRDLADQRYTLGFVLSQTARALVGLDVRGAPSFSGHFGDWFPLSVLLLGVLAVLAIVHEWQAPWRFRCAVDEHERELARTLVASRGFDSLAPFALRADKAYFFGDDRRSFLAYRVHAGTAIVSGDPVGDDDALEPLLRAFLAYAHARDWRVAVLGASRRLIDVYLALGLRALYHGDEAEVDVAAFSLDGRAIRKVRQSVTRLRRAGYTAETAYASELPAPLRAQLVAIECAWRAGQPHRGFSMELDSLFRLDGDDALFVIGRDGDGAPAGFLHFALSRVGSTLSLSTMPRLRSTPNGFNEWLVTEAIAWAAANGFARVSLNFSPFAELLTAHGALPLRRRVERRILFALKGRFQLDNLFAFNRKFFPRWEPRFVVYERLGDLPRVGLAGLALEGYLPLGRRR